MTESPETKAADDEVCRRVKNGLKPERNGLAKSLYPRPCHERPPKNRCHTAEEEVRPGMGRVGWVGEAGESIHSVDSWHRRMLLNSRYDKVLWCSGRTADRVLLLTAVSQHAVIEFWCFPAPVQSKRRAPFFLKVHFKKFQLICQVRYLVFSQWLTAAF